MFDTIGRRTLVRALDYHRVTRPDKVFIEYEDHAISYGVFGRMVARVANGLRRAGLTSGSHVMVFLRNCPEYLVAMFAIQRIGAVVVTCSTLYKEDEIAYQLEHGDCAAVIHEVSFTDLIQALADAAARRPRCIAVEAGRLDAGSAPLNRMMAEGADEVDLHYPGPDELAMLLYTSGTTGRPKGVMYTHGNHFMGGLNSAIALNYTRHERVLHFFPLYHNNGGVVILAPIVVVGATMVMLEKFSASRFGDLLAEHDVTFTALNATHVKMILAHPGSQNDGRNRLYRAQFALPLDVERRDAFSRRFGGVELIELYGMTETLGVATCAPVDALWKRGSAGPPLPGLSLRIVDEAGRDLPPNTPGEIVLRSSSPHGLSRGYYKDEEATNAVFRDGWFATGDTGLVDDDGYLFFLERKKDTLKRAGFNIAAAEIERVIAAVDGVMEVAVVGIPDEFREEKIVAFVVPREGRTVSDVAVIEHCRRMLADYKVPEHVISLTALPENFVGKVEKKKLKAMAVELLTPGPSQ